MTKPTSTKPTSTPNRPRKPSLPVRTKLRAGAEDDWETPVV
jgi:hypothetical protein